MTEKNLYTDVLSRIKAGFPGVYIQTHEEQRVISELLRVCDTIKYGLYIWSCPRGIEVKAETYKNTEGETKLKPPDKDGFKPDTGQPLEILEKLLSDNKLIPKCSVVVLRLFHHFLDDPAVQTYILDILNKFKNTEQCLIITTPVLKLPSELEKYFSVVSCELPTKEVLQVCLDGILEVNESVAKSLTKEDRVKMAEAALGMTLIEAENAFGFALVTSKGDELAGVIAEEKAQLVKKNGILEMMPVDQDVSQIGGLANFKKWLSKRKNIFSQKAKDFGLPSPKGVFLVGPSGSGKTLAAKAIAAELGLPLVRFDIGKAFQSLVGQSENNMRSALATAEAMGPICLILDELDKGLAGSGSGGELDGGTSQRVIGTLLTWMSDTKASVFIVATANNVHGLPPELLRKGRFDEIFSVMLPNASERKDIFELHLTKRNRKKLIGATPKIDLNHFSDLTEGFSGAEIEMSIVESLHTAFDEDRELKAQDLEDVIKETKPLSVSMKDKVDATIAWCKANTRSANGTDGNAEVKATSTEAEAKPTALSLATAIAGSARKIKAN